MTTNGSWTFIIANSTTPTASFKWIARDKSGKHATQPGWRRKTKPVKQGRLTIQPNNLTET